MSFKEVTKEDLSTWLAACGDVLTDVSDNIADWTRTYAPGHIDHYISVLSRVRHIQLTEQVDKVVDVGAIPGQLTAIMKKQFDLDVEAIDIDPSRAKAVFEAFDIPYHQVDIETVPLPYDDNSIDLIVFTEVMEHMRINPIYALKEMYRVLKPEGNLLLSTPNITPYMRWQFLWGENIYGDLIQEFANLEQRGHMGHFRLYSQSELVHYTTSLGFKIVDVSTGGKPIKQKDRKKLVARFLKLVAPEQMKVQTYLWCKK